MSASTHPDNSLNIWAGWSRLYVSRNKFIWLGETTLHVNTVVLLHSIDKFQPSYTDVVWCHVNIAHSHTKFSVMRCHAIIKAVKRWSQTVIANGAFKSSQLRIIYSMIIMWHCSTSHGLLATHSLWISEDSIKVLQECLYIAGLEYGFKRWNELWNVYAQQINGSYHFISCISHHVLKLLAFFSRPLQ